MAHISELRKIRSALEDGFAPAKKWAEETLLLKDLPIYINPDKRLRRLRDGTLVDDLPNVTPYDAKSQLNQGEELHAPTLEEFVLLHCPVNSHEHIAAEFLMRLSRLDDCLSQDAVLSSFFEIERLGELIGMADFIPNMGKMNQSRNANVEMAKERAIILWEKLRLSAKPEVNPSSAVQAGKFISDVLHKQGYKYKVRTVASWIREYCKEKNIKLR